MIIEVARAEVRDTGDMVSVPTLFIEPRVVCVIVELAVLEAPVLNINPPLAKSIAEKKSALLRRRTPAVSR